MIGFADGVVAAYSAKATELEMHVSLEVQEEQLNSPYLGHRR
jgi:hypothetical protein